MSASAGQQRGLADRVAVLGLGVMGLPTAQRLHGGGPAVTGFDVAHARRALAAADGIAVAETPARAARGAAVAVVAVRTLDQAEDCLFGAAGAAAALQPGAVVVLTSTVGAEGARLIARRLSDAGLELLDAPVSGSPARAGSGDLLVLVGGSERAIERARRVLDLLAGTLVVVGPHPGDGQALKTVNQLLCGVHIAAAAEALVLARSLGLDLDVTLRSLGAGAAASFMLDHRGPRIIQAIEEGSSAFNSRLDIFVKDMAIVVDAARSAGLELPTASAADAVYRAAEAAGLGGNDDSNVAIALARTADKRSRED
jgi:3-hydroxyisobutyrate dehydrogenase